MEEFSTDFLSFYQVRGVKFLMDRKRVLIADDMGVGKTAQAVAGKLEIENRTGEKARTVVICPNNVKPSWIEKIEEYCERKQKVLDLKDYSEESLEKIRDYDITLINFDIFSRERKNELISKYVLEAGVKYLVIDEVQNMKNPNAKRSPVIEKIADNVEYLSLLSGTPIPNTLADIYMLIRLLENKQYPSVEEVRKRHWDQPEILRGVLRTKRIKREIEDIAKLPPIKYNITDRGVLQLNEQQRRLYDAIFDNDELEGSVKLQQLRKALLNPSLVNPKVVFDRELRERLKEIPSTKFEALDKIIEEKTHNGEKVVVFSPLYKTAVTDKLQRRYANYGALRIDGDIPYRIREDTRKKFQKMPDYKVLIATTATTGEGISLTAASTVVILDEPYTPTEREQAIARVYRPGQTKPIEVISLTVKDSIDEGVLELLQWKREAIDFIEIGLPLKSEHVEVLTRDLRSPPLMRWLYSPQQICRRYVSRMAGKGSVKIRNAFVRKDHKIGKHYAENFDKGWETSYSANMARVYRQIIHALNQKINLDKKIDLGSGPGVLSHVLEERAVNIDLDEHHFKGRLANPENDNILSSIHKIPVKDSYFDLAVASNSIVFLSLNEKDEKNSEREEALREASRILKQGGYFIMTFPYSVVSRETQENFSSGLKRLGFEVTPELSGYVKSTDLNVDFQAYVSVCRKIGNPTPEYNKFDFVLEKNKRIYSMRKKGACSEFSFFDPDTNYEERLDNRLMKYLQRIQIS